jgi:hypothetical protein
LFQDVTLPERFHKWMTYLPLFRKAKRGLWLGLHVNSGQPRTPIPEKVEHQFR